MRMAALMAAVLLLSACSKQVLFSSLDEYEANEIVAALYAAGLGVDKVAIKSGQFRIDVNQDEFSPAVAILQQQGLPRERYESLGEVFTKDGFVSSPLEERARLNYALSQEIARTISNIDGVMVARVHLAVPEQAPFSEKKEPASVSVFVKHRSNVFLGESIGKIKSMVVTGLENVPYENVTVSLFPAEAAGPPAIFSENPAAAPGRSGTGDSSLRTARASLVSPELVSRTSLSIMIAGLFALAGIYGLYRFREQRSPVGPTDSRDTGDGNASVRSLAARWRKHDEASPGTGSTATGRADPTGQARQTSRPGSARSGQAVAGQANRASESGRAVRANATSQPNRASETREPSQASPGTKTSRRRSARISVMRGRTERTTQS